MPHDGRRGRQDEGPDGPIQRAFGNDYRHAFVLLPLLIASPAFAARGNGGMLPV
jgi:hypothetical protein